MRDFPSGPVVDSMLSLQGVQVQSLVRELRSYMDIACHGQKLNKIKQTQHSIFKMS